MSDDIETAAAATPRTVLERHILDVNVPKSETEWWAHHEIVVLRKALDDRYAADLKAAKAIFAETGRTSGFPSVKEVVAWYVAEVERLSNRLEWEQRCHRVATEKLVSVETERDSFRAKLDRAEEAVNKFLSAHRHNTLGQPAGWCVSGKDSLNEAELFARTVLPELSADAEFNRGMRQVPLVKQLLDVKAERDSLRAEVERLGKENATSNQALAERWNEIAFKNMKVRVEATERERDTWKSRAQQFQQERAKLADKLNGTPCAEIRWQYERDSLLTKLDRAKDGLSLAESVYRKNCVAEGEPSSVLDALQSILSELSADAPAQQTQISDEAEDKTTLGKIKWR